MSSESHREENECEIDQSREAKSAEKPKNTSPGAEKLRNWLNKTFRIEMTDGRVLIGIFLCTDRDSNVILGSCSEFLPPDEEGVTEESRMLGLVMVPGRHIVSIHVDTNEGYLPGLDEPLQPGLVMDFEDVM